MNKISNSKKNAAVKTVIKFSFTAVLTVASISFADITAPSLSTNDPATYKAILQASEEASTKREKAAACKDAIREVSAAENAIGQSCRKAGLGANCAAQAAACGDAMGSESFDTADAIGTVLGLPADSNVGSSCPQMNGRDYYDEKKRLETEIKDTQKDIAELADDEAEIKKTFSDAIAELQQALTDAQQELEETKTQLDEDERKQLADFQSGQNSAKESLREKNSRLLSLRGEMTNAIREKATQMLELTAETSKFTCNSEYTKAAENYGKTSGKSSGNHISKAKAQKAAALDAFNKCMNRFQQARISLNEKSQIKMDNITDQINSTEASIDELNDTISLASTQLEQMKQDTTKKKTNAEKRVTDLMTLTQQKMTAAQEEMQTKLKALTTKQQSYTEALNRANNSLMTLGPAPKKGAEYTAAEASSEISSQVNIIENISNGLENSDCGGLKKTLEKKVKSYKGKGTR